MDDQKSDAQLTESLLANETAIEIRSKNRESDLVALQRPNENNESRERDK